MSKQRRKPNAEAEKPVPRFGKRSPKGQFTEGNPGGPGAGNYAVETPADEPADKSIFELFEEGLRELGAKKFIIGLMKQSPSMAAQFLTSMAKIEGAGISAGAPREIIIETGVPLPGDSDEAFDRYEFAELRRENERLRLEVGKLRKKLGLKPETKAIISSEAQQEETSTSDWEDY